LLKISFAESKRFNWRSRFLVFLYGMVLGCLITFAILKFPFDIFLPAREPGAVGPAADFDYEVLRDVKLPTNARIEARIRYFLQPGRLADLLASYRRSGKFVPMISAIFEEYNLPQMLVFLPILESSFFPHSRSRVGAVGLWQIMPATARDHGLKYNRWIDERRDPEKSTVAAAEYLQFLFAKFRNWDLALAAYNYGYVKLQRSLRRAKTDDYWKLRHIPKETYNFVPNFYAVIHILSNPQKYGVTLPDVSKPLEYESVEIEATFSIDQIARLANVSADLIKKYNPALTANIAPSGKYAIKVPPGVKERFLEQYEKNPLDRVEITYRTYRVRRGDTLYKIARRFGTTVNAIKADNKLRSSRWIKAGTLLRIAAVSVIKASTEDDAEAKGSVNAPEPAGNTMKFVYTVERDSMALATLARYYAVTVEEIREWNPAIGGDKLAKGAQVNIIKPTDALTVHRVRRGDSLWRLSRRYHVSVANLKRWNQLWSSRIYPGHRLIVGLN